MSITSYLKDEHWVSNPPGFCVNTHKNVCNTDPRKYHPHVHFHRDTTKRHIHVNAYSNLEA